MKTVIRAMPLQELPDSVVELAIFYIKGSGGERMKLVVRRKVTADGRVVLMRTLDEIALRSDKVGEFLEAMKEIIGERGGDGEP